MSDLPAFRREVRASRRRVGRTQQQLARAIGVHPDVLSRKLNGAGSSVLASPEALAVVEVLAGWTALVSRHEVDLLLQYADVPPRLVADRPWYLDLPDGEATGPGRPAAGGTSALRLAPVPRPITPFIGRTAVVATVTDALERARLVTLTGPGGTGKSRVALAVAAARLDEGGGDVAFADLSPVTDPSLIGPTLAAALGLSPATGTEVEKQLVEALRPAALLLVVDNVEHLVDGSPLLGRLLLAAPGLRVLATSRVPLHLYGEQQVRVPPLTLPADTAATAGGIRDSEAVQLFLQRARAVHPGLDPHGDALGAVAEICTALDGLPLSIELAAAQARLWPPRAMLDRLQERLRFLTAGARDVPGRQQSLRATLEWSEGLLDERARRSFARLGVFAGSFDLAAAAAVAAEDTEGIAPTLATLVEHSLIETATPASDGELRFRMLESIRHFALDRLRRADVLTETRRAHLHHFADLATELDTPGRGPVKSGDFDRLQADDANVSAALQWVCASDADDPTSVAQGLRLANAVARLWHRRSTVSDGRHYLDALLDAAVRLGTVPVPDRAAAVLRAAMLAVSSGEYDRAKAHATESLQLFEGLGDPSGMSWSHRYLGEAWLAAGDLDRARDSAAAQLELARRAGDRVAEADAYNMLGQVDVRLLRLDEAEAELLASEQTFRQLGNLDGAASVLDSLAELSFRRWDVASAAARWAEALELDARTGNRRGVIYHLEGCAKVMAVNGKPTLALHCVGVAEELRTAGGWVLPEPERAALWKVVSESATGLSDTDRSVALAEGRRASLPDAIRSALDELGQLAR